MVDRIQLRRTNTPGAVPTNTDLTQEGEVAINLQDGLLYYRDATGTIQSLKINNLTGLDTDDLTEGTNLYFTDERVDDRVAALLIGGANTTVTYNDVAGTLTIDVDSSNSLGELTDVTLTGTATDEVIVFNGTNFVNERLDASKVSVASTSATYNTVQHLQDVFHSTGVALWPGMTDAGAGQVTVAAGEGLTRASATANDVIKFMNWPETTLTLTDNVINYIYVDNTDTVRASITEPNTVENVYLGTVYRSGTTLHITDVSSYQVGDHASLMIKRLQKIMPFARESGASIGFNGRNITLTGGVFWEGLNQFTTDAFDSAVTPFEYLYTDAGGNWVSTTANQIDNVNYDAIGGGLTGLSVNRYGTHWVFLGADSDVYVVYGNGNYTLAEAEAAGLPASLPPFFEKHARLVGKVIIQNGAASITSASSPFTTTFQVSAATDHGNLSGLTDDDHPQYHNDTRGDARYPRLSGPNTIAGTNTFTGTVNFNNGADLSNNTTTDLAEGTNLYFTEARVDAKVIPLLEESKTISSIRTISDNDATWAAINVTDINQWTQLQSEVWTTFEGFYRASDTFPSIDSEAYRDFDVSSISTLIDSGLVTISLSAIIENRGIDNEGNCTIYVRELDAGDNVTSNNSASSSSTTPTSVSVQYVLAPGTRTLRFEILARNGIESGPYNYRISDFNINLSSSTVVPPVTTDELNEGDTNLYFANERVDDRVADLLVAGTNITLTYNDVFNTLTIDAAGSPAPVDSVNSQTGVVVLDADDISDAATVNKFTTAGDISKLAGIASGAEVNTVDSVNAQTGVVVLNTDDITPTATNLYLTPGDKGPITVTNGTTWTIDASTIGSLQLQNNNVTDAKLVDMPTATFKGRISAGTGDPQNLTGTQATTLLDTFTPITKGLAPASGGGTTNFLRADGSWAAPAGGGGGGGDVTKVGTPVDNQVAVWTGNGTIEGTSGFTFDSVSGNLNIPGNIEVVDGNLNVSSTTQNAYINLTAEGTNSGGDWAGVNFIAEDSANNPQTYAAISAGINDNTAGAHGGNYKFVVADQDNNGNLKEVMSLNSSQIWVQGSSLRVSDQQIIAQGGFICEAPGFSQVAVLQRTNVNGMLPGNSPTWSTIIRSRGQTGDVIVDGTRSGAIAFTSTVDNGFNYPGAIDGKYHSTNGNSLLFSIYDDGTSTFNESIPFEINQNRNINTVPHKLAAYTSGSPPSGQAGDMIAISNAPTPYQPAFFDGTTWRYVSDNSAV